jgi:tetratricopeptide (TPR) repeat protein
MLKDLKKSKEALLKYLSLNPAFPAEKAESMRLLALVSDTKEEKKAWLQKASIECPNRRDHWVDLAWLAYSNKEYSLGLYAAERALAVNDVTGGGFYSDSSCFGAKPYDIASLCAYYLGAKSLAKRYLDKALEMDPNNERLRKNATFMQT